MWLTPHQPLKSIRTRISAGLKHGNKLHKYAYDSRRLAAGALAAEEAEYAYLDVSTPRECPVAKLAQMLPACRGAQEIRPQCAEFRHLTGHLAKQ